MSMEEFIETYKKIYHDMPEMSEVGSSLSTIYLARVTEESAFSPFNQWRNDYKMATGEEAGHWQREIASFMLAYIVKEFKDKMERK